MGGLEHLRFAHCNPASPSAELQRALLVSMRTQRRIRPKLGRKHDQAGNFFGTTKGGGTGYNGTVFEVRATGVGTTLYRFTGRPDGGTPMGGVVEDASGNLYGVTFYGGTGACEYGCGTIFEITASGQESILYSFAGAPDGEYPEGDLLLDSSGNLYGATASGGTYNCGTLFKYTP